MCKVLFYFLTSNALRSQYRQYLSPHRATPTYPMEAMLSVPLASHISITFAYLKTSPQPTRALPYTVPLFVGLSALLMSRGLGMGMTPLSLANHIFNHKYQPYIENVYKRNWTYKNQSRINLWQHNQNWFATHLYIRQYKQEFICLWNHISKSDDYTNLNR